MVVSFNLQETHGFTIYTILYINCWSFMRLFGVEFMVWCMKKIYIGEYIIIIVQNIIIPYWLSGTY